MAEQDSAAQRAEKSIEASSDAPPDVPSTFRGAQTSLPALTHAPATEESVDAGSGKEAPDTDGRAALEKALQADTGRQKRQFARFTAPLTLRIKGRNYPAVDWSLGGFRIADTHDLGLAGNHLRAAVIIRYDDFVLKFWVKAELIRLDTAKREAAFKFKNLTREQRRALSFFVSAHLSGKLTEVDGLLRFTRPEAGGGASGGSGERASQTGRRWQQIAMQAGVALSAGVLTLVMIRAVLLHLLSVNAAAAWVAAPVTSLSAPAAAVVAERLTEEGTRVAPGTPLLRLRNDVLATDYAIARAELERLDAALSGTAAALDGRSDALEAEIARAITARDRAEARVRDARSAVETAQAFYDSRVDLFDQGFSTRDAVTGADRARIEAQMAFADAEEDLEEAETTLQIARIGYFHGDSRATGEDPGALTRTLEDLRRARAVAAARVAGLGRQQAALRLVSPCDCRVLDLPHRPGARVAEGALLAQLQDLSGTGEIVAFVRHPQVSTLRIGETATVRLPDGTVDTEAEIVAIRTTPHLQYTDALSVRNLEPSRFTEITLTLSDGQPAPPPTGAEVTFVSSPIRWLERLFIFSL